MTKRNVVSRGAFLSAGSALAVTASLPGAVRAAGQAVTLQLDFLPAGRYAPYYLAAEEGFYGKRGLDVTIQSSSGTGSALQQLVSGRAQFGFIDIPSMMVLMGRQPDVAMRSYAVIYAKAPDALFFFEGGRIQVPKDLEGKSIATSAGMTNSFFQLFAAANGIDQSTINWVTVSPASKIGLLLDGKVDAAMTYVMGLPSVQGHAKPGQRVGHFTFGDYGVHLYSNGLLANNDYAAANPQVVKAVVQGSIEGYKAAFRDPVRAVSAMAKSVPNLDTTIAAAEIKIVQNLAFGPQQRAHGLGFQALPEMARTLGVVEKMVLKKSLGKPVSELFSNAGLA